MKRTVLTDMHPSCSKTVILSNFTTLNDEITVVEYLVKVHQD